MKENFSQEIIEKIDSINQNWEGFRLEYKDMKNKVSNIEAVIERPDIFANSFKDSISQGYVNDYLRKGLVHSDLKGGLKIDPRNIENFASKSVGPLELKANEHLSSEVAEGQGIISAELSPKIISKIHSLSIIRKLTDVQTISTNALDFVIEDKEFETGWVSESQERKTTKVPDLKQKRIYVHELYAQPMATQKLIDDAAIDISSWIIERLADQFARIENKAFISGDGNNKPKGILADEYVESIQTAESGKLAVDDILALINSLPEYYLANASFLMHRSVLSKIQTMKDESGRFIWQPSYNDQKPQTIFGLPLYCCDDMPSFEADKVIIALGDYKKSYKIVDRSTIPIIRDPYTSKPFVKFYSVKRVGADVVNSSSIKLLKLKS